MNKVQMLSLSLAAALIGPVHAQSCSGGDGGGMDATGNQCNTPNEVTASAFTSGVNSPAHAAKMNGVRVSIPAAAPPIRSAKMSGRSSTSMDVAGPANGKARNPVPSDVPVQTAAAKH